MRVWAPWETAWPAGLLALGAAAAAVVLARRAGRPTGAALALPLGLFALALGIRLLWLPALSAHVYDGHEAEYWDIFRGVRAVNRGGTVLYPSMQWLWWGLGRVLPHHPAVPVGIMAAVGALAAPVVAATAGRLAGRGAAGVAGLMVALHPVHAAWSSSAYNVVRPGTLAVVSLWATVTTATERRPALARELLAVAAAGLATLTRLELALLGPVLLAVPLVLRPAGMPPGRALARLWPLLPVLLGLGAVTAAGVWPLVYPGEVPGAGERALSFCINRAWTAPLWPWSGAGLGALAACVLVGLWARPAPTLLWAGGALGLHLVMASFDDHADRHALMLLPLSALLAGQAVALPGRARALGGAAVAVLLATALGGLVEMRGDYYADEDAFVEGLLGDPSLAALPRLGVAEARAGCAWISEDHRAQADPPLSHFNLIDPDEVAALRARHGCIRWCQDVQDHRWSSRGVRDRAWRTRDLYTTTPVAVVVEQSLGYGCLVVDVGPRRDCGCTGAPGEPGC